MLSNVKTFLFFAGLSTALSLPIGFAQAAVLEEIIVTSERRAEDLQTVPIAVSALTSQQMDRLNVNQSQDLQRYVPSLNMFNNITHPSNLSLSMRGGLQQDASLVVAESPVGMYVDDIYVGRMNGNNATMSDIERVEVLRGPQGTLYGRNTGYGAVRFISRTPGEDMWADANVGGGNDGQFQLKGSIGGPLGAGLAGSVAGQWKERDGQFFNSAPGVNTDVGAEENLNLRGKLRFMGLDNFDAVLSVAYSNAENDSNAMPNGDTTMPGADIPRNCQDPSVVDTDPASPTFGTCPAGVTTTFTPEDLFFVNGKRGVNTPWIPYTPAPPLVGKPQAETEQTIAGLILTWDITDNMALKSLTGYVGLDANFMTDFTGVGFIVGGSESDSDQFTQEFQILGTAFSDRLNYVAGVYYLNEEADQLWGWNAFGGAPISRSTIDVETTSYSVFGEASFNITDALKVTGGLRYTEDDKDFDFVMDVVFPFPMPTETISLATKPDDWMPKFAIDYLIETDGVMDSMLLYASYAEGFKGSGFSAIAIFNANDVNQYDAETNKTYEGGFKADWFGNRLRTNLAYYFSDIEGLQQNATVIDEDGNPGFPVQNSGDAEIQGLEFEISAVPVEGLNLFFSGTAFTDGEFKNTRPGSAADQAQFLYGVPATTPQTPDYSFNIGFDYSFDFRKKYLGAVTFGMDYYEIDDYVTAATNEFYNTGWDQLNGFISADLGDNFQLKLSGTNLSDNDNLTSGSRGLGGFIFLPEKLYMLELTYQM